MKDMSIIMQEDVLQVMQTKGYEIFSDQPNIVGVRNSFIDAAHSDFYDDRCFVWYADQNHDYTITTHPGHYYLQHPIAGTKGTAILVPGQYKNCWKLGMHRGKQFALCQRLEEVKVYRDDKLDGSLIYDPSTIESGFFGIDLHHGDLDDSDIIGPWSAGCQVFRYEKPHADLMIDFQKRGYTQFSYTLLLQSDFN